MRRKICLLFILFCSTISGQNYVKNSGFEEYYHLPDTIYYKSQYIDSAFESKHWYGIRGLTPNYFHIDSKQPIFSIPYNISGYYPVLEGSAYVATFVLSLQNFATPLLGEFIKPLEEGKEYEVSFYYCFAHLESYFLLDKIETYISPDNWVTDDIFELPPRYTHIVEPFDTTIYKTFEIKANVTFQDSIINDGKWHKMTGYYKAKGGEKYITLGIFYQSNEFNQAVHTYCSPSYYYLKPNKRKLRRFYKYYQDTLFIHRNPLYSPTPTDKELKKKGQLYRDQYAYYFFDNVSVVEIP